MIEPKNKIRKILITPHYYLGKQEWYMGVFECPKCQINNPILKTNFCRGCGISVKMAQTVMEYENPSPRIYKK